METTSICTAEDYANNYYAFIEYIDTNCAFVTSREDFDALTFKRRVELAQLVIDANAN